MFDKKYLSLTYALLIVSLVLQLISFCIFSNSSAREPTFPWRSIFWIAITWALWECAASASDLPTQS